MATCTRGFRCAGKHPRRSTRQRSAGRCGHVASTRSRLPKSDRPSAAQTRTPAGARAPRSPKSGGARQRALLPQPGSWPRAPRSDGEPRGRERAAWERRRGHRPARPARRLTRRGRGARSDVPLATVPHVPASPRQPPPRTGVWWVQEHISDAFAKETAERRPRPAPHRPWPASTRFSCARYALIFRIFLS